jgi:hypothetical protein
MISKREKYTLALTLVLGLVAFIGLSNLTALVIQDYKLYQAESECVNKMVMKNYRRKDIKTGNGTCWIKGVEQ